MPRFGLKEFHTPDFAGNMPTEDVQERPLYKVQDMMAFLNTIPWFKKDDSDGEDGTSQGLDDDAAKATTAKMLEGKDTASDIRDKANTEYFVDDEGKMRNFVKPAIGESVELNLMRNADPATEDFARALKAAELNRGLPTDYSIWEKAKAGQEAQAAENEAEPAFNPKSLSPAQVKEWQKVLGVKVDGIWGPITQKAFDKWESQQRGE